METVSLIIYRVALLVIIAAIAWRLGQIEHPKSYQGRVPVEITNMPDFMRGSSLSVDTNVRDIAIRDLPQVRIDDSLLVKFSNLDLLRVSVDGEVGVYSPSQGIGRYRPLYLRTE